MLILLLMKLEKIERKNDVKDEDRKDREVLKQLYNSTDI
ncbi:MAG: hypothetical protein UR43_C0018G0008 [candidate division TM6 bacterium GW2011_GWF2_33_332]|nr:MAG: hypothetical protein UR43_C0018G0008 [candidate division TM6 bacterium GW2011_GWF2_33_332]